VGITALGCGQTFEEDMGNKKGRDLGHFFQSPGIQRETYFLHQSGDAHRSPKADAPVAPQAKLWTAARIAALGCGRTCEQDMGK